MKVFIDTAPLLYLTEGTIAQSRCVKQQIERWLDENTALGVSVLTLAELLVGPRARGDLTAQYRYRTLLGEVVSFPFFVFDDHAAEMTADLVGKYQLPLVQAQQLALAMVHEFDVMYTDQTAPAGFRDIAFLPIFAE